MVIDGLYLRVGASVGIARYPVDGEDADTLTALGIYPQSLGTLDVTEGDDTLASLGLLPILATSILVEDSDTASSDAVISILASLDCTEEDDTLTAVITHTGFGSRIAAVRQYGSSRAVAHSGVGMRYAVTGPSSVRIIPQRQPR